MARPALAFPLCLALVAPLAVTAVAVPAGAQSDEPVAPRGEGWRLDPRVEPGQGFTVTTEGTVGDRPARLERSFDLSSGELTVRYVLGDPEDPERRLETQLRIAGVYVFEDDGDGRLDVSDRIVEHQRVDPEKEAYVTPVRSSHPLSSVRAVVGLEDSGQVVLTLTASPQLAMMRSADLAPTETRLNLTVADVATGEDQRVAIALDARAPEVDQPEDALVRLEGEGAGLELTSLGAIDGGERTGATAFEQSADGGERALVLLAGPRGPTSSHEAEAGLVHSAGLAEVQDAVRGQAGPFLLGLVAASLLVGATAWRKLND